MAFAIDFFTGFETGSNWPYGGAEAYGGGISALQYKTGSYSYAVGHDGYVRFPSLAGTPNEAYFSAWVWIHSATAFGFLTIHLTDAGYLQLNFNGTYIAANVNGGAPVATGTHAYPINTWFHIEVHVKAANSGGVIQVKYEGLSDISYSGDTQPGAVDTLDYARFDWSIGVGATAYMHIDNWFQGTGGWPGDLRADALLPASDVAENWTPSTGTDNYVLIKDRPASDASYIYSETNLQQNRVGIDDWDDTNKTPVAIAHWVRAKKDPANLQTIKILEDLGGTQSLSAAIDLTTTATDYYKLSLLDPNGDPWTDDNIDALTVGVEAEI